MKLKTDINKKVEKLVLDEGLELVDTIIMGTKSKSKIKFLIDRSGGVTLDECVHINRLIAELFDRIEDDFKLGVYRLEVSSPGVDYPLKCKNDFQRNINRDVTVIFTRDDEEKKISGKIVGVNEEEVEIKMGKKEFRISICSIKQCKLKLFV